MGDMKGTNTTTQKVAPDPRAMQAYQDLLNRASGVASQPYQAYTGNLTAGVNQQQNLGIAGINNATQAGAPWFNYASSMAHPIGASDIERYQNPYTQQVVNATQAQFDRSNQQAQERLQGQAIAQGALGGSRAKIAAADLGYQQQQGQAPVIAGLYNQGYNQALGTAQQQQQAGFQGAGVGSAIQQAGLQGAGAQIGAGTLQQQTEQNQLNALYQQYQQAQAFPYQQTQWLAGIDSSVGPQMGGTAETTAPAPSLLSQVAGAGVAGAGVASGLGFKPFAARGGRIEDYDAGGSVGAEPYGGVGWIPQTKIGGGRGLMPGLQPPAAPQQHKPSFDPSKFGFPRSQAGVGSADPNEGIGGMAGDAAPLGGMSEADALAAAEPAGVGGWLSAGMEGLGSSLAGVGSSIMSALPEGVAAALPFLLLNRGGGVRGYAEGGAPDMPDYGAPDEGEGWPVPSGVAAPAGEWLPDAVKGVQLALSGNRGSFPTLSSSQAGAPPAPVAGVGAPPSMQGDADYGVDLPPEPMAGVGAPPSASSRSGVGGFDWSSLSMPLITAGLGMMASRSPHALVGIGEGGLQGVQAYAQQQRQTQEHALAEKKQALDSRRLDQMAQQARESLALRTKEFNLHKEQADRPYREMTVQQKAQLELSKVPPGMRRTEEGNLEYIPGGTHDPEVIRREQIAKIGHGLIDDDTLSDMAEQYLAGDKSVFQNIGRGAQGGENISRLRQRVTEIAREKGLKPDQIATKMADFAGRTAAMRALGTRGVNVEYAANTALGAIDLAEESMKKLNRSMFVPWNQLVQLVQNKTSSPEQADFYAKTNTLVNEYARVAAGGSSQATEGMRQHAREMLNTAMGRDAYQAVLNAMRQEIATAKKAYNDTRKEFLEDHSEGAPKPGPAPVPAASAPAKAGSAERDAAMKWLAANPNDPRAPAVRKKLGIE